MIRQINIHGFRHNTIGSLCAGIVVDLEGFIVLGCAITAALHLVDAEDQPGAHFRIILADPDPRQVPTQAEFRHGRVVFPDVIQPPWKHRLVIREVIVSCLILQFLEQVLQVIVGDFLLAD